MCKALVQTTNYSLQGARGCERKTEASAEGVYEIWRLLNSRNKKIFHWKIAEVITMQVKPEFSEPDIHDHAINPVWRDERSKRIGSIMMEPSPRIHKISV